MAGCAARRDLSKHEEEGEGERKRGGVGGKMGREKGGKGRRERGRRHKRALQACTLT
jgi:DeoR/GlpR family transcriptional regulator of sugar metabolism